MNMLARLILAYASRQPNGITVADMVSAFPDFSSTDIQSALDTVSAQGLCSFDGSSLYVISESGSASLLTAQFDGTTTPTITDSLNTVFSEATTSPDATFLPDLRTGGFTALDARDLSYLVAEYGIGACVEFGDVKILSRCAHLAKLAAILSSRI